MTIRLRSVISFCTDVKNIGVILLFIWIFLCLTKLPATLVRGERPQTWEAVLSFASVNHLQWGKDIIYTYGPLGYLISDHYWGDHYLPIIIWSFVFSGIVTPAFISLSFRLPGSVRFILYTALPWLAISPYADLGFEALYLLSIGILTDRCFPERRCGVLWLLFACAGLGAFSLIKFTFCLFSFFALVLVFTSHLLAGQWKRGSSILLGGISAFLVGWWVSGQQIANLPAYLNTSAKMTMGYSSAMSLPAAGFDLAWGGFQALCLGILLFNYWKERGKRSEDSVRYVLVGGAAFLAWKEGFVRADLHVVVFFGFSFFLCALMPVILNASERAMKNNIRLTFLGLIVPCLALWFRHSDYIQSGTRNFVPRMADAAKSLFAPQLFYEELTNTLTAMKQITAIPRIRRIVGTSSIGVLGTDQHVAILNDLTYRPHPVFQSYGAYDDELLHLNSSFFDSKDAPSFLLWRYGTIDYRFPTLDDGKVMLRVLDHYTPVLKESAFWLWRRKTSQPNRPSFGAEMDRTQGLGTWLSISGNAAIWLKIKVYSSPTGSLMKFLYRASRVYIDVQTDQGQSFRFNLILANAVSGFLLNPFLPDEDSLRCASARSRIVAIRVIPEYSFCFEKDVDYSFVELGDFPLPDENATMVSGQVTGISHWLPVRPLADSPMKRPSSHE